MNKKPDPVIPPFPETLTIRQDSPTQIAIPPAVWEETAVRVADYLRACGLKRREELTIITDRIMQKMLHDLHEKHADETLAELAIRKAQAMLDEWLEPVLENPSLASPGERAALRETFLRCRGPALWGGECLRRGRLPEEAVAVLRRNLLTPVPTTAPLAMVARDIEFLGVAPLLRRLVRRFGFNR